MLVRNVCNRRCSRRTSELSVSLLSRCATLARLKVTFDERLRRAGTRESSHGHVPFCVPSDLRGVD